MMIEIKITYGTDITAEAPTLRKLAAALLVLAGDNATTVTASSTVANVEARRQVGPALAAPYGGPVQGNGAPGWKIAPNDVPDVGAARAEDDGPLVEADPAQVFGAADPDPAQVFGGNVAAGSGSASSPSPASTVVALQATHTTYAAEPTGDTGNVPGATFLTPSGTPAAPNNGVVTAGVSVDSRGLPWDGRIHAGTKTTNKDGSWKKKPNVEAELVAQVEAELRAVMAIPAPNAPVGAPATPPVSVPPPPPASVPGNVATPTPPVSAPTTAAGVASSIASFAQLLPAVTNALASGQITEQDVANVLAQHGVAVLPQLAPRPDLVQSVAASLGL